MEQQKNNLDIMKIRRKAEKEGRALSEAEEESIHRLESSNKDLAISMAEGGLEQQKLKQEQMASQESLSAQEAQYSTLNKTVQDSTMGLTSLSDMMNTLATSGASTAQILEIFGVRGGGAINALLGQTEGFNQLVTSINDAGGATEEFSDTLKESAQQDVYELQSAMADLMLNIGEELTPTIVYLMKIFKNDLIPIIQDMMPLFKAIGVIIKIVAISFKFWLFFMKPLFNMIIAVDEIITALFAGDWIGVLKGVVKLFGNFFLFLSPIFRLAYAFYKVATSIGWVKDIMEDLWDFIEDIPIIGDLMDLTGQAIEFLGMADGGVVTSPTAAIVGEGGEPEVVAPLSKLTEVVGTGGAQALVNALPGPNPSVGSSSMISGGSAISSENGSVAGSSTKNNNLTLNISKLTIEAPAGSMTATSTGSHFDEQLLGSAIGRLLLSQMAGSNIRGF